jgi:predicted Ser/Thr protein kinase
MRVYDGESLKESDPKARSVQEYKDAAGVDEGMDGVSTRFAFKKWAENAIFSYLRDVYLLSARPAPSPIRARDAFRLSPWLPRSRR